MSAFRIVVPPATERVVLAGALGLVVTAAWAVLWLADPHVHGILHFPAQTEFAAHFGIPSLLLFVTAWTGMSVAMMLPTSLPVLTALHTFASDRGDRSLLVALTGLGYLTAWIAAGALVGPVSLGLQAALAFRGELGLVDRLVAPTLLLLAGLFQFSALKYRCLEKCRSPLPVVFSYWHGHHQRWRAFRLGWASGVFCVGCCWALMLLSSVGHLAWMLALGLVMVIEKNVRWGWRLRTPLGVVLIVSAGFVLVVGGDHGLLARMAPEFCGIK